MDAGVLVSVTSCETWTPQNPLGFVFSTPEWNITALFSSYYTHISYGALFSSVVCASVLAVAKPLVDSDFILFASRAANGEYVYAPGRSKQWGKQRPPPFTHP